MAQVPATSVTYTGTGAQTLFSFNVPYQKQSDVFVEVDGVITSFTFSTSNVLSIIPAPALDAKIIIYRSTASSLMRYVFDSGVAFVTKFADANWQQLLYAIQEAWNTATITARKALRTPEDIPELPNAAARANKGLGFNGLGEPALIEFSNAAVPDLDLRLTAVEAELPEKVSGVANVAALSGISPVLGEYYYLNEYYSGTSIGGGHLKVVGGSPTVDNGLVFASATVGLYFQRMGYSIPTASMYGARGDANSAGSSGTYDQGAFTALEAALIDKVVDLEGRTYLVGFPIPHLNTYINGGFVVAIAVTDDQPANASFGRGAMRDNTFIPRQFPSSTLTFAAGNFNTAFGSEAMLGNTTGRRNTAIGSQCMYTNGEGFYNTAVGAYCLFSNDIGDYNTAVGTQCMQYNTSGISNSAFGSGALNANTSGSNNVAVGDSAFIANLTGNRNIAIGVQSLSATTNMSDTIAIGYQTLSAIVTGTLNLGIGTAALSSNTSGSNNNAIGHQALLLNTTGGDSVAIGVQALSSATTGGQNTAVGRAAGGGITTGVRNVAVGRLALNGGNTSDTTAVGNAALNVCAGDRNTAVGSGAGSAIDSGTQNTLVGAGAGAVATTSTNNVGVGRASLVAMTTGDSNVAVGQGALGNLTTGTNNVAIGNGSGNDAVRNITTTGNEIVMGNNSHTGAFIKIAWTVTSDKRDKKHVRDLDVGLDFVNSITPKVFHLKDRETGESTTGERYGFYAQDLLNIEGDSPVLVNVDDLDNLKLNESMLVPILFKAIQELTARIESLEAK